MSTIINEQQRSEEEIEEEREERLSSIDGCVLGGAGLLIAAIALAVLFAL